MKKTFILLVMLLVLGVVLSGCDVIYDIQKDDSVIITVLCDEDDVDEFGEDFDFDEGDLDNKGDLEDVMEDVLDEYEDMGLELEGEINVKKFDRTKNDDFTLVFEYIPTDDVEDAIDNNELAIGTALDVLDVFADKEYDEDFEDIYDDELSDDVDDEIFYAFDKEGDEMTDKEMEKYFDSAKLTKLKAAYVEAGDDMEIFVPGKIQIILGFDDSVDIDDGAISSDTAFIVVYKTGSSFLTVFLILALLAGLGVGGYFAYDKFFAKKGDESEVAVDVSADE